MSTVTDTRKNTSTNGEPKTRKPRTEKPATVKSIGLKVSALLDRLPSKEDRQKALDMAKLFNEMG